MAWIVKLVSIGAEGEEHSTDVMRIARPDTLADLGTLGLSLAESKQLLAGIQREIVAAQARLHAMRRPACPGCGDVCRMKVESRVTTIASAPVSGLASACAGKSSATLKVWRRRVSGSTPASTGNSCAITSAAVR